MIHDHIQDFQRLRDQTLQGVILMREFARFCCKTPCLDDWLEIWHGYLLKVQVYSVDLFLSCDPTYKFKSDYPKQARSKKPTCSMVVLLSHIFTYGQSLSLEITVNLPTVDGRNPADQLRSVGYPIIYMALYIWGGAGFLPSAVSLTQILCILLASS